MVMPHHGTHESSRGPEMTALVCHSNTAVAGRGVAFAQARNRRGLRYAAHSRGRSSLRERHRSANNAAMMHHRHQRLRIIISA